MIVDIQIWYFDTVFMFKTLFVDRSTFHSHDTGNFTMFSLSTQAIDSRELYVAGEYDQRNPKISARVFETSEQLQEYIDNIKLCMKQINGVDMPAHRIVQLVEGDELSRYFERVD